MRVVYVKAPFNFEIREIAMPEPGENQVLLDVRACAVCGTDMHTAAADADCFQSFGHEIAGVVVKNGPGCHRFKEGDKVRDIKNIADNRSEVINILLNMNDDDKITVDLIRDNRNIYVELTKSELNHSYLIEKIPYSATLTYIDENNQRFGAVAHSLENKETKNVLNYKGEIYLAN